MFADYHVHTAFSDDSTYPMDEVLADAVCMHMDEICFTEHVDYGIKVDWEHIQNDSDVTNCDYPKYIKTIDQMKEKYKNQIKIKTGLEFGMQTQTIFQYEKLFSKYDLDFVLLSIHQVDNLEFWNQDYQKGKSQKEYNEGYYKEMYDLVKAYKNYSVLAHMDLITRYDKKGIYPFKKVENQIAEILKVVIADDKGIELNMSSKRYGLKDATPSNDILKLYKDLGGKILTIGSDSHKPDQLGKGIAQGKELLKSLGFTRFCTFEKMAFSFCPL